MSLYHKGNKILIAPQNSATKLVFLVTAMPPQSIQSIQVNSRSNTFFKALRAVAITGVIYRHVYFPEYVVNLDFWDQHFLVLTYFLWGSFTVSLFIFLSGYFSASSFKKSGTIVFWKKRFMRLGIPFIFWSIFYIITKIIFVHHNYSCLDLVQVFLLGKACIPFYFFIVLFQLILLTPLLFSQAKSRTHVWLPYVVSFLYVIAYGYGYMHYNLRSCQGLTPIRLFIPWLALFWSGMLCNLYEHEFHNWLSRRKRLLLILTICTYLFSFMSIMYLFHVRGIQTTLAVRNLSVFTFIPINFLLFVLFLYRHTVIQNRLILLIGSYSYGIFLIHMLFLRCFSKLPVFQMLESFPVPYIIALTVTTLSGCVLTIWLVRKLFGEKQVAWIGF